MNSSPQQHPSKTHEHQDRKLLDKTTTGWMLPSKRKGNCLNQILEHPHKQLTDMSAHSPEHEYSSKLLVDRKLLIDPRILD